MASFRIHTDPTDRLTFDSRHYTVLSWNDDKVRLRRRDAGQGDDGIVETLTTDTISSIWARSDFRYERYFYSEYGGATGSSVAVRTVATLNKRDKPITLYKLAYVKMFLALLAKGTFKRTYDSAAAAAEILQPEVDGLGHFALDPDHKITVDPATRKRKVRVGKPMLVEGKPQVMIISPPSGYMLMEWLWDFEKASGDPMSLAPKYRNCGFFGSHLDPEVEGIVTKHLAFYLTPKRPTPKEYLQKVQASVGERNQQYEADGDEKRLQIPGMGSIRKTIDGLGEYYVLSKRHSEEYARMRLPWVTDGLDIRVPGQRVEFDAYQVDVMVLMCWSGFWEGLTREQRRLLKRKRLWLTIAIDRATRVIVGMRLSATPDVPNAISTLEMVESDKTEYSRCAGTQSVWSQRCGVMTAVADGAYMSSEIRTALADARASFENPQAGDAPMRAVVERIFRTVSLDVMARLDGKTFNSIFERADYDSAGNAGLTVDELAWIMVTWVVDIYHNTVHHGLKGRTPGQAWDDAAEKWGVHPWRDAHGRRSAFGLRIKRKLRSGGFEVLGNRYQDDDPGGLRTKYCNEPGKEFELCVDVRNLGAVSVIVDEAAFMIPCKDPRMDGVQAADWIETTAQLRSENHTRSELPREVAHAARLRIEQKNEAAGLRANIARPVYSTVQFDHQEKELFSTFEYSEEPEDHESDILGDSIHAMGVSELLSFARTQATTEASETPGSTDGADAERPVPTMSDDDDRPLED
jgi:putative transposase